jgi:hypothetical protein
MPAFSATVARHGVGLIRALYFQSVESWGVHVLQLSDIIWYVPTLKPPPLGSDLGNSDEIRYFLTPWRYRPYHILDHCGHSEEIKDGRTPAHTNYLGYYSTRCHELLYAHILAQFMSLLFIFLAPVGGTLYARGLSIVLCSSCAHIQDAIQLLPAM